MKLMFCKICVKYTLNDKCSCGNKSIEVGYKYKTQIFRSNT